MRSLTFITLAAASLALAACGSSSSSTSTDAANTAGASNGNNNTAIQFSSCMRSHGVPNFPDSSSGGTVRIQFQSGPSGTSVNGVAVNGPAFKSAMTTCRKYLPNGGNPPSGAASPARQKAALEFAACMRNHGVPNFPDPKVTAGGVMISAAGLDPNSPAFKAAQQACGALMQKLLPGGSSGRAPSAP
jgi:hypothetical protein